MKAIACAIATLALSAGAVEARCVPLVDERDPALSRIDRRALGRITQDDRIAFAEIDTFPETAVTWRGDAPAFPQDAPLTLELHVVGSFGESYTSVLAWRDRGGAWSYARASLNMHAPPPPPPPPPPPDWPDDQEWAPAVAPDTRFHQRSGAVAPDIAAHIETLLADRCRAREPDITPAFIPMRGRAGSACYDGPLYQLIVRREGEVSERILQGCQARWRTGQLLRMIDDLGAD